MRNLPTQDYAQETSRRSNLSVLHAQLSTAAKKLIQELKGDLALWSAIFINSPVILATALFWISIVIEVIFSMPMYLDIMSQMTGNGNYPYALTGAFFIVAWGACASHYLSKSLSLAVYNFNLTNKMGSGEDMLQVTAEEELTALTRRDLLIGIILSIPLLLIVVGISWQRVWMIGEINGGNYTLIHKLLPVICVMTEIFSGIYLGYVFASGKALLQKRMQTRIREKEKKHCIYQTNIATALYRKAIELNQFVPMTRALRDTLFRERNRAIDSEDYTDPVPADRSLRVIIQDGQTLVSGVHIYGIFADGRKTGSATSDPEGIATIHWTGDQEEVSQLIADGEPYQGPFIENIEAIIHIRKINNIRAVNA